MVFPTEVCGHTVETEGGQSYENSMKHSAAVEIGTVQIDSSSLIYVVGNGKWPRRVLRFHYGLYVIGINTTRNQSLNPMNLHSKPTLPYLAKILSRPHSWNPPFPFFVLNSNWINLVIYLRWNPAVDERQQHTLWAWVSSRCCNTYIMMNAAHANETKARIPPRALDGGEPKEPSSMPKYITKSILSIRSFPQLRPYSSMNMNVEGWWHLLAILTLTPLL